MSDSQQFDDAIERLLDDQSPAPSARKLTGEERRMLQMAQLIRGASGGAAPDPAFAAGLRSDLGVSGSSSGGVSRKAALIAGLGSLAAGLAAGVGLEDTLKGGTAAYDRPLVGANGRWTRVARVDEVPSGTVKPFMAGSVAGFLVHSEGRIYALSRACTHMGCLLTHRPESHVLECPCHGAEFDLYGSYRRGSYASLPKLPWVDVRVRDQHIEVWATT